MIPGLGRPAGEGKKLPTPVFWPGELHGLYSPWGHKELDTTERLPLSLSSLGFPDSSVGKKKSACNAGDLDLISGLGRSPGEGNSYYCIVHGIAKSWT